MTFFLSKYPTFGTKNNRKNIGFQKSSPYYWWWEYMRRNKDYLASCEQGGKGKCADLYQWFGDVRDQDFRKWWMDDQRGAKLFAETPAITTLKELRTKDEWEYGWVKEDVMVVAVPMTKNKRDLQRYFAKLLKKRHTAKRGRVEKAFSKSTAKFPLSRNFTVQSLETALLVYDKYLELKALNSKAKLWEVGVSLGIPPTAMPEDTDTKKTTFIKRNQIAATIGRYLNQAETIITNTGMGRFP
jgi:hypothetical protein